MINSTQTRISTLSALILVAAPAHADTSGFQDHYAPKTWTITGAGIGGASAVFAADGSELAITGGDGAGAQTTSITHPVVADGLWSFDWSWYLFDGSDGFDLGYYLLNGVKHDISFGGAIGKWFGHADVPVVAGDVIGWQVVSLDGLFGSGVVTITDFRAPVPGPPAFALLGLAAMPRPRRRC